MLQRVFGWKEATFLQEMIQTRCKFIRPTISNRFHLVQWRNQVHSYSVESVLRLETKKYITEPLMSLLFVLSTCPIESNEPSQAVYVSCLKFDEFLSENIHCQLMDFHRTKTFRFQSYLLKVFLSFNEENLQLPEMVLTEEMSKDYSKFMNFPMSEIYHVIF